MLNPTTARRPICWAVTHRNFPSLTYKIKGRKAITLRLLLSPILIFSLSSVVLLLLVAMPAWWGRKSKTSNRKKEQEEHKSSTIKSTERPHSFDESLIPNKNNLFFKNKDLSPPSGFDSDGVLEKKGHPLPRPSSISISVHDHGSVSSVSSSGSSDDPTPDLAYTSHYRYPILQIVWILDLDGDLWVVLFIRSFFFWWDWGFVIVGFCVVWLMEVYVLISSDLVD